MSQKIDGGITASTPVRQVATPNRTAAAGNGAERPVEAADSLRLTGEAASLQAMQRELSNAPAINEARVQAVREALQAGTDKFNAEAIADGMLGLEDQLGG